MKKIATIALVAAIALPGLAGDTKPPATPAPAKSAENESPLVRAARLSSRKGKKPSNVITNKTLKDRGRNAHITTSTIQSSLPDIPVTPPTEAKVIVAPKSETATEEPKKKLADSIESIDDPFAEVDPAKAERMAAEAAAESAAKGAPPAEKPPRQ